MGKSRNLLGPESERIVLEKRTLEIGRQLSVCLGARGGEKWRRKRCGDVCGVGERSQDGDSTLDKGLSREGSPGCATRVKSVILKQVGSQVAL